jgi:hypothetical protein
MEIHDRDLQSKELQNLQEKMSKLNKAIDKTQTDFRYDQESTAIMFQFLADITKSLKHPKLVNDLNRTSKEYAELSKETKDTIKEIAKEYKLNKQISKENRKLLNFSEEHIEDINKYSEVVNSDKLENMTQLIGNIGLFKKLYEDYSKMQEEKAGLSDDNELSDNDNSKEVQRQKNTNKNTQSYKQRQRNR